MLKLGLSPSMSQWQVACFATDCGLVFFDKIEPGERNPLELIWASRDGETRLHYVDDAFIDLKYLALAGAETELLAGKARASLAAVTLQDALDRTNEEEDQDERLQTASLLGVLAPPQYEPSVFNAYSKLSASPDAAVRRRTVIAASYVAWPEFKPLLKTLATDADASVHERARVALDAFNRHG